MTNKAKEWANLSKADKARITAVENSFIMYFMWENDLDYQDAIAEADAIIAYKAFDDILYLWHLMKQGKTTEEIIADYEYDHRA